MAVLSLDGSHGALNCSLPHELLIVRVRGWGLARCVALKRASCGFIVIVNGDVDVEAELWPVLLGCGRGEFFMTNYRGGACSRVFAGWVEDVARVGFDAGLKYIFEDGDFYVRALRAGLRCRVVPDGLFSHVEHRHDFIYNPRSSFLFDIEYSRMMARYKFFVRRDLFNFFLQPWCLRRLPNMLLRVFATLFFVVRGALFGY